jgi:hypothetical protein
MFVKTDTGTPVTRLSGREVIRKYAVANVGKHATSGIVIQMQVIIVAKNLSNKSSS